jgi:invasion protein IalB
MKPDILTGRVTAVLLPAFVLALVVVGYGQQLPGDATSVQETYESWVVGCAQQDAKRVCSMSQQQADNNTHQRVLAIELSSVTATKADGTLVLPFGLAVAKDVVFQVDGAQLGSPLHFRTCVQGGCVVTIALDSAAIGTLKKGSALTIKATADGDQPIVFTLSLKGFSSAFDRTALLQK